MILVINEREIVMSDKKIAFTTLGCKVNLYDTEAMIELFAKNNYEIVDFDEYADIYVINTCTVTNLGDKKSRQMIRRAKRLNPQSVVVATGCYAQVAPKEVEAVEGINIVIGTKERSKVVEIIESYSLDMGVENVVSDIMGEHEFEKLSVKKLRDRTRAYLKIQEGCNRFCTYCIIPYARGPVRSRKPEEVVAEVKELAKNGFKEIVLAGIHVGSYGVDLENMGLIDIIKQVHNIEGIERIRFSSIEPKAITEEFVSEIKNMPKVCDHFHLSLQSGSDTTLKRMNRRYSTEEYFEAVQRLRAVFPDVAVTTDIIVGFPAETEEEFIESCEFAKRVRLSKIHVFPYSPKKGTPAAKMKGQLSNDIKSARAKRLIEISNNLNGEFMSGMLGKEFAVLFEQEIEKNVYEGHTTNYVKVIVKSDCNLKNEIRSVLIKDIIKEETVSGELVIK